MDTVCQNINIENFIQTTNDPILTSLLVAFIFLGLIIGVIVSVGIYVYVGLALSKIAKNMGYGKTWLAWIPVVNLFLFPVLTGRKWVWGLLFFIPIVNVVFLMICLWKLLEKEGYDGKWSLVSLGFLVTDSGFIAFVSLLVILGVLAWKKK